MTQFLDHLTKSDILKKYLWGEKMHLHFFRRVNILNGKLAKHKVRRIVDLDRELITKLSTDSEV